MNRTGARPERGRFWGRNCMNRALVFNRKAETGLVETRSELSVSIRTGGVSREETPQGFTASEYGRYDA